jgi:alpha-D-xyloside xylohydrolase
VDRPGPPRDEAAAAAGWRAASPADVRQRRLMSVPRALELDLGDLRELQLGGLRPTSEGHAVGDTDAGPLRVEFHAPGLVRLRIGENTLPDYGLTVAPVSRPAVTAEESAGVLTLTAGDLAVAIDPASFSVTLARGGVALLGPPRDGHFRRRFRLPRFARNGRGWFVAIDLAEGEPVYGHGEKWGRLDHRGQRVVSWNEDALGTNAEISYKNCPFAWSPRGWGLFANTPGRVVHGAGFAPWSHRSYVLLVEDDTLDLFLIAAPDPAAVLERYTWLTGRPAAVPRWSLGTWLSKAYYRDADEFLAAARRVRELRLPMDVITLDGRAWQDTATRFAFEWDRPATPTRDASSTRRRAWACESAPGSTRSSRSTARCSRASPRSPSS